MLPFLVLQLLLGTSETTSPALANGTPARTVGTRAASVTWHDDYSTAYLEAVRERKDLLIHFREDDRLDAVLNHGDVVDRLAERFTCLRVPCDYEHLGACLLKSPFMEDMLGRPGLAIVSLHDASLPTHKQTISAHPLIRSRYGWAPDYGPAQVRSILDLPPRGTLSQRSMIYAVSVHPERPRSILGEAHPALLAHAKEHSARQAAMQHQHHADLIGCMAKLRSQGVPASDGSEVVAESWGRVVGGENVLEAAFSCIDAWRHSPGHWGAVSRQRRYFGYDVARGANGTWYATGIFCD